jgi:hypothetical protein
MHRYRVIGLRDSRSRRESWYEDILGNVRNGSRRGVLVRVAACHDYRHAGDVWDSQAPGWGGVGGSSIIMGIVRSHYWDLSTEYESCFVVESLT